MGTLRYRAARALRNDLPSVIALAAVLGLAGGLALFVAGGAHRTLTAPDRYEATVGRSADAKVAEHHADGPIAAATPGRPDAEHAGATAPGRSSELSEAPGVRSVRSASFVFGALVGHGSDEPIDSLVFAGTPDVSGDRIVSGTSPDPAHPGDFCASQGFVDRIGAHLGDRWTLITISQATATSSGFDAPSPDGPTVQARLVCTMAGPSELQEGYAVAVFPRSLLDVGDIGIADTVHLVDLAPGTDRASLQEHLDAVRPGTFQVQSAQVVPDTVRSSVQARGTGIAVVALIIAAAAVVVVGQLAARQLRLRPDERNALGSMGMGRRELAADPIARAIVPVVLGTAIAALVALVGSRWFPLGFVHVVEPTPGWRFDPLVHLVGPVLLALGVLATCAASLALDGRPPRVGAAGNGSPVLRRLGPTSPALGLRFLTLPGEKRTTIVSLAGSVVLLATIAGALTFSASMGALLDTPRWYGSSDLMVGQGGHDIQPGIVPALVRSRSVTAVALGTSGSATIDGTGIDLVALQPERGDLLPQVVDGRLPIRPDEIAFGRTTAEDLGLRIGSHTTVTDGKRSLEATVTGVVVVPSINGADGIGQDAVVTPEALHRLEPDASPNVVLANVRAPIDRSRRAVEAQTGQVAGPADLPSAILALERIRSLPLVVAGALLVLVGLAMGHQLLTAAGRHRRDSAVLAALGATPGWRASIVRWQGTALATATVVVGVPLGVVVGRAAYRAFIARTGSFDATDVPWTWLAALAIGVVVLANLVASVPARRVRRRWPAQDLHAE